MAGQSKQVVESLKKRAEDLSRYYGGIATRELALQLGREPSEIIRLSSNENLFLPLGFLQQMLLEVVKEVDPRLYPGDESTDLKYTLGRYLRVSPEEILLGAGSDPLIELFSHVFLNPGDGALSVAPTFPIYERCVRTQGASYMQVPLREDFSLDVEEILNNFGSKTKLLFLCSPNNPTANQFDQRSIERLAEELDGIVVVDEAYVDFSRNSLVGLVGQFENLVVIRTLSKAFGLAGIRIGYAVSNDDLTSIIEQKFQIPYGVPLIALRLAQKVLGRAEVIEDKIREVKAERRRLVRMLGQMEGVRVFDSQTNFVLLQLERDSDKAHRSLLDRGIIVRNIGRVLDLDNCLRVTVAPRSIADKFLHALADLV